MGELVRLANTVRAVPREAAARRTRSPIGHEQTLVARAHGRRDWVLRRVLVITDVLALALAMGFMGVLAGKGEESHLEYLLYALITLPVWVVLFKLYGLYERDAKRLSHSTLDDLPSLFHALLLGSVLLWCWFSVAAPHKLVFASILVFAGAALTIVATARAAARGGFARMVSPERVLLVGSGPASSTLIEKMRARASLRLEPIGIVSGSHDEGAVVSLPRLGAMQDVDLTSLLVEHDVGRVVVSDAEVEDESLLRVLRDCRKVSVKVSLLPATGSALGPSVEIDDVQGITVLGINPPVLSRSSRAAKRSLDLAGAGLLLMLVLPVLALLAVAIMLDSPGPVLFRQERIGRGGKRFKLAKLRSMSVDAEARRAELLALSKDEEWLHLDHDPRVTRVGRLLRLTSLDELPQLWNVLRGEMSLVGPRPLVVEEDRMVDDWARGRLDLTPGITGLWQVLGRTSIRFEEMMTLDYLYVTNWSLWGDVRLILRTLPAVLRRDGAN